MTGKYKPPQFYEEKFELLEKAVDARRGFTVREAGEILGYGKDNTASTLNCLLNLVRLGKLEIRMAGKYRKYYLP